MKNELNIRLKTKEDNIDINELKIVLDDSKEIKVNMDNIYMNLYKIYNL
mgnify:CR=1 FL=1